MQWFLSMYGALLKKLLAKYLYCGIGTGINRQIGALYRILFTARFARKVGNARRKFKVIPPETTGDPGFVRHFRAQ